MKITKKDKEDIKNALITAGKIILVCFIIQLAWKAIQYSNEIYSVIGR